MTIYTSPYEEPTLPDLAIFNYIFPEKRSDRHLPDEVLDNPNLTAYIDGMTGRQLSRGQLRDTALRLSTGLRKLGLKRGQTAVLSGPNSLEWIIAAFGLQATGMCVSPANAAYGPDELAHQFNDSGAATVVIHPALVPVLEAARGKFKRKLSNDHVILLCDAEQKPVGSPYRALPELYESKPSVAERFDGPQAQEVAWLCYSSGTTGLPKGVMTTHHNLTSQLQAQRKVYPTLLPDKDAILGVLPCSHIFGLALIVHQPLTIGVPVVLFPKFDELAVLKGIEKYKVTFGMIVPPILLLLLHSQNTKNYDLTSLKNLQSGAAPLSASLAVAFEKKFPHCQVVQAWGLTETSPGVTYTRVEQGDGRKDKVGQILPTWEIRLVTDEGVDAEEGGEGEIWCRGPSNMKGYHNNPKATADSITPDGWFKTGDVGQRDKEGFFSIVDRKKELIKYKGFQVPPAELEGLLLTHPKVIDTGVIGVWAEEQATELPRAYIVANPSLGIKTPAERAKLAKEIGDWVAQRVAQHKKLRGGVVVIDAIPKSPSGKILRKDLRVQAKEEMKNEGKGKL